MGSEGACPLCLSFVLSLAQDRLSNLLAAMSSRSSAAEVQLQKKYALLRQKTQQVLLEYPSDPWPLSR
jgi:hypothetical protein